MADAAFDVIVIGAGGAAAAWGLADAGARVLVLEAGPRFDPRKDYHLDSPDWELHDFPRPPGSYGSYTWGEMQPLERRWDDLRSWNHVQGRFVRGARRLQG